MKKIFLFNRMKNTIFLINIIFLLIVCVGVRLPVFAFAQTSEYTLKAVYIKRITSFIEWPDESGIYDIRQPVVISVIGNNPFDSILDELYSTLKIKKKKVDVRYITKVNEIQGSQILFISKSKGDDLPEIIKFTENKPILTIGDTEDFSQKGVLINFYLAGDKLRFELNESAFIKSKLSLGFKLRSVAKIINPVEINK